MNLKAAFSAATPPRKKADTEDTALAHQDPHEEGTDENAGFVTPEPKKGLNSGHLKEGNEEEAKRHATEEEEVEETLQEPTAAKEHATIDPKDMGAKTFKSIVLENMPKDDDPELEWSIRRNTNTFKRLHSNGRFERYAKQHDFMGKAKGQQCTCGPYAMEQHKICVYSLSTKTYLHSRRSGLPIRIQTSIFQRRKELPSHEHLH